MMKNRLYSLPVKTTLLFLFVLSVLGLCAGGAVSVINIRGGVFGMQPEGVWNGVRYVITRQNNAQAIQDYENGETESGGESNYRYEIRDLTGTVLADDYEDEPVQYSLEEHYSLWVSTYDPETGRYLGDDSVTVTITGYVLDSLTAEDAYASGYQLAFRWYQLRYVALIFAVVCLCSTIVLFVLLMSSAGHRRGQEKVSLNRGFDRIPFDLYTAAYIGVLLIPPALVSSLWIGPFSWQLMLLALMVAAEALLFAAYTMSLAARVKTGTLVRKTLCFRLLRWILRGCRWIGRSIREVLGSLPLLWQTIVVIAAVSFVELIALASSWYADEYVAFWFLEKLILVPLILWIVLMMRKLQQGGEEISQGKTDGKVDTRHMWGPFRRHAENLNSINGAISKAVEERMKSEHFKTELITNVSHDIKTPLTSIINYVDLIRKLEPEDGTLREYIDVLDRQSVRLKKLIEDLVEASKASTGNLAVNMAPCEVGVLLGQAIGEYEEKLRQQQLDLQVIMPEEPVTILADGRHLWRVFDNLLNNICKYSQAGTRVYLNLESREGTAYITFRNISKYPLNISSEELMERFVRGDGSRHTEGSGLGLSIARSLVELQHGTIELIVDGDLFKVILTFQTV